MPLRACFPLLLAGILVACGINPQRVTAIRPERDFTKLTCEDLAAEAARIDVTFKEIRWSNKAGTLDKLGRLKGEAAAVNDGIPGRKLVSTNQVRE